MYKPVMSYIACYKGFLLPSTLWMSPWVMTLYWQCLLFSKLVIGSWLDHVIPRTWHCHRTGVLRYKCICHKITNSLFIFQILFVHLHVLGFSVCDGFTFVVLNVFICVWLVTPLSFHVQFVSLFFMKSSCVSEDNDWRLLVCHCSTLLFPDQKI